jgi:serine/threonine-protein kinase
MRICFDQMTGTGCGAANRDTDNECQTCGRSLRYALDLLNLGTMLHEYNIVRVIGHGSFGAVYEAKNHNPPPGLVALKETLNPDHIEQFQGEFEVLRDLHHSNLPRYYRMFVEHTRGYLVMEMVEGKSLYDILQEEQRPLLETQVLGYAVQLCDVLNYLHEQRPPILHRDIKPANIRFTPHGVIKLVDFGLFKRGIDTTRHSRRGLTAAYAPIEQYGGQEGRTDARTDIYSLGATLYHLLTFQSPLPVTERIAYSSDQQPSPLYYNPYLSPAMDQAIRKAMSIRPEDRFDSAAQFRQALIGLPFEAPGTAGENTMVVDRTCPVCGTRHEPDEIYCQECGHQLSSSQRPCSECRTSNPLNARFCVKCGKPL